MRHFTIRELFLLIVIAAIGFGWYVDGSRLRTECRSLRDKLVWVEMRLQEGGLSEQRTAQQLSASCTPRILATPQICSDCRAIIPACRPPTIPRRAAEPGRLRR